MRYQTASDLRAELKRLRRDTETGRAALNTERSPHILAPRNRSHYTLTAVTLGLLVLGATLVYYQFTAVPPRPHIGRIIQITHTGHQKNLSGPLLTDGSKIYFTEIVSGHTTPSVVPVSGGESAPISESLRDKVLVDISPDGNELLATATGAQDVFEFEGALLVISVVGGTPRRVGDLITHDANWSPDGQQIAYSKGNDLFLANADGSRSRRLFTAPLPPFGIRWARDGTKLRFQVYNGRTFMNEIWEVSSDGANPHALLPEWVNHFDHCCGNWTHDGSYFVFWSSRGGSDNIWARPEKTTLLHRDSLEPFQVTMGPLQSEDPLPSKDGKRLFVRGVQPRSELVSYDTRSRNFVPVLHGIQAKDVEFSSDGRSVAFVTSYDDTVWRCTVDGSNREQLTVPPLRTYMPQWSPDGTKIAFMAFGPGSSWKIYIVSANGGNPHLLFPGSGTESDPNWSPDGSSLLFQSARGVGIANQPEIYLLNLKDQRLSVLPESRGMLSPRWSADGRYVVALTYESTLGAPAASPPALVMKLFDFKTRQWTDLAKGAFYSPAWSRDAKYVYCEGQTAIYRVEVSTHKLKHVADTEDLRRYGRNLGRLTIAPDGSLVLAHEIGVQEIYALDWQAP